MRFLRRRDDDDVRAAIERDLEAGHFERARKAAERLAGTDDPVGADLVLLGRALLGCGRYEEAVATAQRAHDLGSPAGTSRVLAQALNRLARWTDGASAAEQLCLWSGEPDDWRLLAVLSRRSGHTARADEAFKRAHELGPEDHPLPHRVDAARFDQLVGEALDSIPEQFERFLDNTLVEVADQPSDEEVREGLDPDLLGLYTGATALHSGFPERIVIFKLAHEDESGSEEDLRELVRQTVLHEIGHHFGMEEDELPY
jgi:predicted Zn-dependent protease with MMP-like domain